MKKKSESNSLGRLDQDLKQENFGRLYVLYGEEVYLRERYLFSLKNKVVAESAAAFNLQEFDGREFTVAEFEEAMDCLPMMAERTLLVITDWNVYKLAEDKREAFMVAVGEIPSYCTVVLYYDIVEFKRDTRTKIDGIMGEYGLFVNFERQDQGNLVKWVQQGFKNMGREIAAREANELIFYCGDYMTKLASEMEKIGAYAEQTQIKLEDIHAVATPHLDAVVFEMTNALGEKNYDMSLGVLAKLYQMQEHPLKILKVVSRQIRQVYGAKLALEQRKSDDYIISMWKMHPYVGKKIVQSARTVSLDWCRKACISCAKVDKAMKSGGGDPEELLTQFVLELGNS